MSDNKIAEVFGIENEIKEQEKTVKINTTEIGIDETDDYVLSRSTLRTVVENGANALDELLKVAKQSQKARDYEVAAGIMKTLADITKNLKEIHEKPAEKRVNNLELEHSQPSVTVEKAIFVGTTAELLKQYKKAQLEDGSE